MSYIQIRNVHKNFDGNHALRGIDLDVKKGETIAIIGPSGCGKTTLLRCLALLDDIDEGEILINGTCVVSAHNGKSSIHVHQNQYRARTGFVFQHLNIWPHLTILQNLLLAPMAVLGQPRLQATDKAERLLNDMGIIDKKDQYPSALSGGQLQRAALARALMMNPEVLLLDEITSALDPELVGEILDIIVRLAESGMTMLIVTHEVLFASEVANKIVFIESGQVIHQGPIDSLHNGLGPKRLSSFISRLTKHRTSIEQQT